MLILNRKSINPYFNLAAEEFLVKNISEPCFMIWQNSPSIIIGKHQNPLKEVNLTFAKENNIPIIRRISGGGTVYHDSGNINYSFIDFGNRESLVNFEKYSKPIVSLLQNLGVNAYLDGKSDLKIDGLKFSGNASHVYKNRVLHHGTLLFNSDLKILNESIKIQKHNITDKAIKSNRAVVCNISSFLSDINKEEFKTLLVSRIKELFPKTHEVDFSQEQVQEIEELVDEKYSSWDWNFGYSPRYFIHSKVLIKGQTKEFTTEVYKGFIQSFTAKTGIPADLQLLINKLIGKQHEIGIIQAITSQEMSKKYQEIIHQILF